jgi:hypothetical protein
MISRNARESFNHLFVQGFKGAMVTEPHDLFDVSLAADLSAVGDTKCVAITVSSYLFRLMVLVYFTPQASTTSYFSRANRIAASDLSDAALTDAVCEFANMSCGAMSRDLSRVFPNIGMSTPNIIDKECSSSLGRLHWGHIQHFKLEINKGMHFFASLCVSDYADLDFLINTPPVEVSGELELF